MPETKTGLPTLDELRGMAVDASQPGSSDQIEDALREVQARCLRTLADRFEDSIALVPGRYTHAAQRVISDLREAAEEAERG